MTAMKIVALAHANNVLLQRARRWACIVLIVGCGGQSGDAPGAQECRRDSECAESVNTGVDELRAPQSTSPDLTSHECERATIPESGNTSQAILRGSGDDVVCTCATDNGDIGFILHEKGSQCLVHSRARKCLYSPSDFPGCDPADADSCKATCAELTTRLKQDAETVYDADVRSNRCVMNACEYVLKIEDTCYAKHSNEPYDCKLTDDEIIEQESERLRQR